MEESKEKQKSLFKKRLYNFTLRLIRFIDNLPHDNVSRRLGDQLLRSGTSIIANYIEGQAASSRKDFTNFMTISLKSANESKLWVSLIKDSRQIPITEADMILKELIELSRIFASSIITLKNKR
ncbi:MAG: four helix bundle protein [Bacteroidetes bacterium]|nr:four helix bundle protein [Bacteroidota bacterium]